MLKTRKLLLMAILPLAACSTQYRPDNALGVGGYTDKQIDANGYAIRYELSATDKFLHHGKQLLPLWKKRAEELCGSTDYYYDTSLKDLDMNGNEQLGGFPTMFGVVYCNNRIQDTRLKAPDEAFLQAQSIPSDVFITRETNPLWDYLSKGNHDALETAISEMHKDSQAAKVDAFAFKNQTKSLIRLTPSTETLIQNWIKAKPDSAYAHWILARYHDNFGWHRRGNGYWNEVAKDDQTVFVEHMSKARASVDLALVRNQKLCEAHALRIQIAMTNTAGEDYKAPELFKAAIISCPDHLGLHGAYFRNLYPQWNGSQEEMESFVNTSTQREALKPLRAWLFDYKSRISSEKNSWEQKMADIDRALEIFPNSGFYLSKAALLESREHYVDAIKMYAQAADLDPYSPEIYAGLSRTLAKQSRMVDALIASLYASRSNAFEPSYYYFQGNVFYEMRRYDDALSSFESALLLEPGKAYPLHRKRATQFQIDVRKKESAQAPVKTAI